jgi:effector-binding domain-containing protein
MIESPQIIQTSDQLAAIIPITVPREQIMEVMMPGLNEIMAAVKAQGIGPAGVWFTHHLRIEPEIFDFEICVPVTAPVKPVGRVIPGVWPGMKVIRTVYHGSYEGMGDAWGEFESWIEAQDLKGTQDLWERYLVGPEVGPDGSLYRTELNRPLAE